MARPADKLEHARRVAETEKMMAIGMSHGEIQNRIASEHDCTTRSARRYIVEVQKKWAAEAEAERPFRRHQTRTMLRTIAQRAMAAHQYGAAVSATARLMELDGLQSPIQVKHEGAVDVTARVAEMKTGDRRERMRELLAKAGVGAPAGTNGHGTNGHSNGKNGASNGDGSH